MILFYIDVNISKTQNWHEQWLFIFIVLFKNRSFVHNYYMFFGLGQLGQLDLKVAWHDLSLPSS